MFDIYSTQSYTCTVEMMGCAWIQPMMYFVLTNVPMFKGSYMIMNVKHSITQGDMTTTFTGCRMAKTTNKLVENIFTDDFDAETPDMSIDTKRERYANTNNNCPYKVYNLFESDDYESSDPDTDKKAIKLMNYLIDNGANQIMAAGIVGNMFVESGLDPNKIAPKDNGAIAAGLVQWNDNFYCLRCMLENEYKEYGHKRYSNKLSGEKSLNKVKEVLKEKTAEQQCIFIVKSMKDNNYKNMRDIWSELSASTTASGAAKVFCEKYEIPDMSTAKLSKRQDKATDFYKAKMNETKSSKKITPDKATKNDLYTEFMRCLRLTVNSTDFGKVRLEGKIAGEYLMITQGDNKTDKLPLVFDIILQNYYEYVQELLWVYPKNELKNNPARISVILSMKPDITNKKVLFVEDGNNDASRKQHFSASNAIITINRQFLLSVTKKFKRTYTDTVEQSGANGKQINELPQFDELSSILTDSRLSVSDCDDMIKQEENSAADVINTEGGTNAKNDKSGVAGKLIPNMMIGNWRVSDSVNFLVKHAYPKRSDCKYSGVHICAYAVQQAIIAGGIEHKTGNGYRTALALLDSKYWNLVASGQTNGTNFKNYKPSVGDIMGMTNGKNDKLDGHICLYCGSENGWISDFVQCRPYVYGSNNPGKFWVIRYGGNGPKTTLKPDYCLGKGKDMKCLRNRK